MGSFSIWHWVILLVIVGIPLVMLVRSSRRAPVPSLQLETPGNEPMSWKRLYFGMQGRINRKVWWISHLVQWITVTAAALGLIALVGPKAEGEALPDWAVIFIIVAYLLLLWTTICINAKRWHDRDKSGWMQLIGLIPLVGLWALIENGFLRGTDGPNRFGPNPLAQ